MTERHFWHGGSGGRKRGEFLLPPTITQVPSCSEFGAAGVHRRDRVYVTTQMLAAEMFAAFQTNGVVYLCEPIGLIEPDPDCSLPGLSWQCEKARVLRVIRLSESQRQAYRAHLSA
jgi:hypothetical protein